MTEYQRLPETEEKEESTGSTIHQDLEESTSPIQNTYLTTSPPVNNVKVIVPSGDTSKYKMTAVLAGDFSLNQLEAMAKKYFGAIPSSTLAKPPGAHRSTHPEKYLGQEAYFFSKDYASAIYAYFPITSNEKEMARFRNLPFIASVLDSGLSQYLSGKGLATYVSTVITETPRSNTAFKLIIVPTSSVQSDTDFTGMPGISGSNTVNFPYNREKLIPPVNRNSGKFWPDKSGANDMNSISLDGACRIQDEGPQFLLDPPRREANLADIKLLLSKLTPRNMNIILCELQFRHFVDANFRTITHFRVIVQVSYSPKANPAHSRS
eukprot:sb/3466830/